MNPTLATFSATVLALSACSNQAKPPSSQEVPSAGAQASGRDFDGPGTYHILSNLAVNRVVDADTGTLDDAETKVQIFNGNGTATQQWEVKASTGGAYTINIKTFDKYVRPTGKGDGDDLLASAHNKKPELQQWYIERVDSEAWKVRNHESGYVWWGDEGKPRTRLKQRTYENKSNCHWKFQKVE